MTRLEILTSAGEALFGEGWRTGRGLAIALGPHHPFGPRAEIDSRLLRRWINGGWEIPQWVIDVLPVVLAAAADRRAVEANELYDDVAELRRLACQFSLSEDVSVG
jgi:hypothetical protein